MIRSLRAAWLLLATSVRVGPAQALLCLAESVGNALMVLQPVLMAWLVEGAVRRDEAQVVAASAAFVVSLGGSFFLLMLGCNARILQVERVGFEFDRRVAVLTAGIPTLEHLESPEYLDQLQNLRDQEGALGGALNQLLNTINNLVGVVGTLAVAASADWRLLLVAAAGAPLVVATRWTVAWQASAEKVSAPRGRLARQLLRLGLEPVGAAELRVFGLAGPLRQRVGAATAAWRAPMVELARRQGLVEGAGTVLFFAVAAGVLGWMVHDAIAGRVSLGVLTLAVLLVTRLQNTSHALMWSVRNIARFVRTSGRFLLLQDYEQEQRGKAGSLPAPAVLHEGIRMEAVSYAYAGSAVPAVDGLTLDLPAGTVVAVVGDNGAGKSTLVKLLTGMYRPTSGTITVDGVDLAAMDLEAWRRRCSGAFQDYARLELSVQRAVGVGDLDHVDDAVRVGHALREGASEAVVSAVPGGLDAQLGATWPDGVELSGGQWQRLAIARGMMRAEPLLLVLDEPTAALDATTEHALFERYAAAARAARGRGAVTLLVTHRFSTVAAADLVVVLDGGRLVESGTHAELLAAGGRYAELYHLQARGYR